MNCRSSRLSVLQLSFVLIFLLPVFSSAAKVNGQGIIPLDSQEEMEKAEADSLAHLPFPVVGITRELGATERLLADSEGMDRLPESLADFNSDVDSLFARIGDFLADTSLLSLEDLSSRELDQIAQQTQFYRDQVDDLLTQFA